MTEETVLTDADCQMKDDAAYLRQLFPLVDFLGEVLGPRTEVVLHDAANPKSSIIAIANGQVSSRGIGSPATDFLLRLLRDGAPGGNDYVVGYRGKSAASKNFLVSSTCLIRRQGRVIGALCINSDQTPLLTVEHMVGQLKELYFPAADHDQTHQEEENLVASVEDIVAQVVNDVCVEAGARVDQLDPERRLDIMKRLNDRGCFSVKGSVARVAEQLGISESSAYRYLHMVAR